MLKIGGVNYLRLSALGAAIAIATAGPAAARGIAIDQVQAPAIGSCALGGSCSPNDFAQDYDYNFIGGDPGPPIDTFNLGVFNKVYVYDDGVISIGKPLPTGASLAGGLASLGNNYIAAGFADLADLNTKGDFTVTGSVDPQFNADNTGLYAQTVNVEWIFDMPSGQTAILGVSLTDLSNQKAGEIAVSMDSGAANTTWFGANYPDAYCDAQCAAGISKDNFGIEGVYLPEGALLGSGFGGFGAPITVGSDFTYPGFSFKINVDAVPEPGTWMLAISGFFLMGGQLRRARRRPVGAT